MEKRKCINCSEHIPPETEHYTIGNEIYCTECVDARPYTAHQYYVNGDYMGDSEGNGDVDFVESYEDYYDES